MSNQRRGSTYAAGPSDRSDVPLKSLIQYAKDAQAALEAAGYEDPAYYFEQFHDYLVRDVVGQNKPLKFATIQLGL